MKIITKFVVITSLLLNFATANASEIQSDNSQAEPMQMAAEKLYFLTFDEAEKSSCSAPQIIPEASSTAPAAQNFSCSALMQIETLSI